MTTSTAPIAIGIDLGGTNLKIAAVDREGRLLASVVDPNTCGAGPDSTIKAMVRGADRVREKCGGESSQVVGVGVGTPGPIDVRRGVVLHASNLPGWKNVAIRDELAARFDLPVAFDNDANLAAYGEHWVGAGRGGGDLVMLTLGTGVGGGVIVDGRILHGHFDNAGELGHMIVEPKGLPCSCGQRGCLEQYASAAGVARRAMAALEAGSPSSLEEPLRQPRGIDAGDVAAHATRGDELAMRIWNEACFYLALVVVNVRHAFNPERIVLGGGMSDAGDFLITRVCDQAGKLGWSLCDDAPQIVRAALGNEAGVIGAARLAWSRVDVTERHQH